MSSNILDDSSEGTSSNQSYSENEDVNTESDTKSATSQCGLYTNARNEDDVVIINQIDNVITNEKHLINYNNVDVNGDHAIRKPFQLRKMCCTITTILIGLLLLAWGLVTIVLPIYDFVLIERLKMQPGLPPFEEWRTPSPEVLLRVYIFSVENPAAFLNKTDDKLKLKEIGPIVYKEHLQHRNVEFHRENSTLSYTAHRDVEFLEDRNEPGILNRTILVPNFVLLATIASLEKYPYYFVKFPFQQMLSEEDTLFLNMTVRDYLWNYKSDIVERVYNSFFSFLVPTNNSGCLYQIYSNFEDRYNVRIGAGYGFDHFFEITSMNGATVVPGFQSSKCNASIVGSTEGALYKNRLDEDSVLWYWRKSLCRQVPLYFEKNMTEGSFDAKKYVLRENVYDRFENETEDCYKGFVDRLPNGFSDVSKCFFDMPFAASNPHFYGRYPNELTTKLDGLKPDREKHQSFIIVEPVMGVPINQSARSQSNVIIPKLTYFNEDILRFSNMALPTFWVEYHQKQLTPKIEKLMYFTLFVLPWLQYVITIFLMLTGLLCLTLGVARCMAQEPSPKQLNTPPSKFGTNYKLQEAEITWNIK
ncbi:lysosome membrane protein 2-like [Contarinia nasturtii]|uniref:lysosome membrane protein 2-like n=1 Tax=Contarinia nasturtii TaxID=265458 RepID=UPI0012D3EFCB|nr:lysosome membrane protein 2-like [Contarinia nasturtii]